MKNKFKAKWKFEEKKALENRLIVLHLQFFNPPLWAMTIHV